MRAKEFITESTGVRLKDLATVKTNFPDADFWLQRKGSDKSVGTPTKEYSPENIGIKVTATDVLDSRYLYYMMQHIHNTGYWRQFATGALRLVNLPLQYVANLPLGMNESLNEDANQIRTEITYTDYYEGQHDGYILASANGKSPWADEEDGYCPNAVGGLEFSIYEGRGLIKMVNVKPEFQRMGVGTALVKRLEQEVGKGNIDWGYVTDAGKGLHDKYQDLDEAFSDWAKKGALAAGGAAALAAGAGVYKHATTPKDPEMIYVQDEPAQKAHQLKADPEVVNQMMSILKTPNGTALTKEARAAGMKGRELAQFLAQCAHESLNFGSLKELGGKLDFKKYDIRFHPEKAKLLGNDRPGDGAKYAGRGFIQLTGKDNYKKAGHALGLPLEERPELVERPDIAAKVAIWFWQHRVHPRIHDYSNTRAVTKPINSGLAKLQDRQEKYMAMAQIIGVLNWNKTTPTAVSEETLDEYKVDNVNGLGSVPYNANVDYMGLRVLMKPSMFLKLAHRLDNPASVDHIVGHIEQGGALGSPFLTIDIPREWENGDFSEDARVSGHEGRNRMMAIQKTEGDEPVEVHLFPRGGMRARHLTPDIIKHLQHSMLGQDKNYVTGNLFEPI